MTKRPLNTPDSVGDRVRLRGRNCVGEVVSFDPEKSWASIRWDNGGSGPKICHRNELEKVE